MKFTNLLVRFVTVALMAVTLFTGTITAQAQDSSPEHIAAAKKAMIATGATSRLDGILPEIASFTKAGLIANRPDIESEISLIVDETAISLAARRGALEEEVAAIYTKLLTIEELKDIETFFTSGAGTKFLTFTPQLFKQIDDVSKVWRTGVTRDMATQVQEKLKAQGLQ